MYLRAYVTSEQLSQVKLGDKVTVYSDYGNSEDVYKRQAVWMLSACGNGTPDYDATGTFEATEVIVSAEAAGKLLQLEVEEEQD